MHEHVGEYLVEVEVRSQKKCSPSKPVRSIPMFSVTQVAINMMELMISRFLVTAGISRVSIFVLFDYTVQNYEKILINCTWSPLNTLFYAIFVTFSEF